MLPSQRSSNGKQGECCPRRGIAAAGGNEHCPHKGASSSSKMKRALPLQRSSSGKRQPSTRMQGKAINAGKPKQAAERTAKQPTVLPCALHSKQPYSSTHVGLLVANGTHPSACKPSNELACDSPPAEAQTSRAVMCEPAAHTCCKPHQPCTYTCNGSEQVATGTTHFTPVVHGHMQGYMHLQRIVRAHTAKSTRLAPSLVVFC